MTGKNSSFDPKLEAAEAKVVLDEEGEPEDRRGEEEGVDAVEDASVAGEDGAGVFDACSSLDGDSRRSPSWAAMLMIAARTSVCQRGSEMWRTVLPRALRVSEM